MGPFGQRSSIQELLIFPNGPWMTRGRGPCRRLRRLARCEAVAVLRRAEPGSTPHLGPEIGGGPEAAAVGNQVHRRCSRLDEAACEVDALGGEPRQRRAAYLGAEPPVHGGDAEMSVPGQVRDG